MIERIKPEENPASAEGINSLQFEKLKTAITTELRLSEANFEGLPNKDVAEVVEMRINNIEQFIRDHLFELAEKESLKEVTDTDLSTQLREVFKLANVTDHTGQGDRLRHIDSQRVEVKVNETVTFYHNLVDRIKENENTSIRNS